MFDAWITSSWETLAFVVASAIAIYAVLIVFTRLVGLRSFAKMSAFDFAMTVAAGAIVSSVLLAPKPPLANGIVGLAAIFGAQASVAWLRRRYEPFARLVDNRPVLLMDGGRVLHDNLGEVRVTEDDLRAKLREANVLSHDQIRAVVMETTGDISVLHGPVEGPDLEEDLLEGVQTPS